MNEPKIRFKGFEGEWNVETLNNLSFTICSGKDVEHKGRYPLYGSTGIIGTTDKPSHKGKMLLVARVGANAGKLQLIDEECGISDNTLIVKPKEIVTDDYLYYYFMHYDLNRFIYGSGQPLITGGMLKTMLVHFGNKPEREKVCKFFTTLDSQISASASRLASLKQVKEASLQAMFPQEGENVPKIRFNGFEGEWKKVKLHSLAKRITRKNSNLESTLALTIASAYGLVSQKDYFNNSVVGANLRNYYLLKKGEFAYNKSYSNGFPFGSVKRLDRYEQGILSTLYIVFAIDNSISTDYVTHFFDTSLWHKEVAERAAEGARNHGLLNIGAEDFLDINILKPQTKDEQQAIASYFTALDRKITLQSQRLEKLKQIKAACLDKMFV